MELALEGGRPILLPPTEGRDISVEPLGCCDAGGEGRLGAYPSSTGGVPSEPYLAGNDESLLLIESGEVGPEGSRFITSRRSGQCQKHAVAAEYHMPVKSRSRVIRQRFSFTRSKEWQISTFRAGVSRGPGMFAKRVQSSFQSLCLGRRSRPPKITLLQ